tara:strand:+ start:1994 stop:2692 length:699 start_codon:yes stop_codon:yes gene_type:complete
VKLLRKIYSFFFSKPYFYQEDINRGSFDKIYDFHLKATMMKPSLWRKDRFYNLWSIVNSLKDLDGLIAECGVWKGLSCLIISEAIKENNPYFKGENIVLIDSFEGLSQPKLKDGATGGKEGDFSCSLDDVRNNLNQFPQIEYFKGWVPEILDELPQNLYKFVHLDMDLVEPTIGALNYFSSRMTSGGLILLDDYSSKRWPNLKKEVDAFVKINNLRSFSLSTCQKCIFFENT